MSGHSEETYWAPGDGSDKMAPVAMRKKMRSRRGGRRVDEAINTTSVKRAASILMVDRVSRRTGLV